MTRNQIIEGLFTGKNFNDCICKMEPPHLRDDLKMEVISIVCEWPEEKVIQLYNDHALEFYVVRVILNQVKSKTSPFTKKYRQVTYNIFSNYEQNVTSLSVEHNAEINKKVEQKAQDFYRQVEGDKKQDLREREIRETLQQIAIEEIDKLYWYDAELIRLYMKLGTFRAIEEHTGIPFISCYKNIKKSLATLKRKAFEKAAPLFSKEELKFIQNNKP